MRHGLNAQTVQTQATSPAQQILAKTDRQLFIENKGQWPSEVLYLTSRGGLDVWITK